MSRNSNAKGSILNGSGSSGPGVWRPHLPKPRPTEQRTVQRSEGPSCHLVVMVKEPVAGRVKTRLARDLGAVRAVGFYRNTTEAILTRLAGSGRWHTYLAVTPDSGIASPVWPSNLGRIYQGTGNLGQRMQRIFDGLPAGPVVIIGSDVPQICAAHIAEAFQKLGGYDGVLGPAPDGGYWLVGLKRKPTVPRIFEGVRWSSPNALEDTLANLAGHRVALLPELDDVDHGADFSRLQRVVGRTVLPIQK